MASPTIALVAPTASIVVGMGELVGSTECWNGRLMSQVPSLQPDSQRIKQIHAAYSACWLLEGRCENGSLWLIKAAVCRRPHPPRFPLFAYIAPAVCIHRTQVLIGDIGQRPTRCGCHRSDRATPRSAFGISDAHSKWKTWLPFHQDDRQCLELEETGFN
jgi:hypothetical protein